MNNIKVKIGDNFRSWFKGTEANGDSRVLDILPYTGKYPKIFDCVLVLSASNSNIGKIEQAYKNGTDEQ